MPNYLVLEWGRIGIRGLAAEVTSDRVQVRASFAHAWPAELDAMNDSAALGTWLKSQLHELDVHDHQLIVLVSREDVATRLLALPDAGDESLPDLVTHQLAARSSVSLDQLAFDFVPLNATPFQGGRWVQTATVPQTLLQRIKTCLGAAGFDASCVGMSTVASGEAIACAERGLQLPAHQKRLVVCVVRDQVEVAMWRGIDLLFSHVARAADSKVVAVEVQRALMSHDAVAGSYAISRVWLIAPAENEAELRSALATRLGCDVIAFDPTRDMPVTGLASDSGPYIASIGALLAIVQSTIPTIDFLNPRRREIKPDRTKMIAAVAVGALLVLFTAAYSASRLYVSSLDKRIAANEATVRQQDKFLKAGEPTRAAAAMLSSWDGRRVDWLDQMQRISAEMPGTDRVYLDTWRFDLATDEALGTTAATGFARERQDAQRLTQRLAEQAGFRVRPNPIGTGGSDPAYPFLLQLDAEVVTQPQRTVRNESK